MAADYTGWAARTILLVRPSAFAAEVDTGSAKSECVKRLNLVQIIVGQAPPDRRLR
jgi:hypothetical protein